MTNLMMTYHNPNIFPAPFKFDELTLANMEPGEARALERKLSRGESIHSGHFMVSEIEESDAQHEKKPAGHESDYEQEEEARLLSDYEQTYLQTKETSPQPNMFGHKTSSAVKFDGSLAKLFECMSLAYNGKITSPKWKTFKGLKLHIKDKIRLNNIIWRAWHIQYIAGRNPVVCQFSSSADSNRHKRTEAILLEGKYWKRRVDAVKEEYKKWRMFHRKWGGPQTPFRPTDFDWENSLPRWSNTLSNIDSLFSSEDFHSDFLPLDNFNAQNLFSTCYDYNPRENVRSSSGLGAQFMQPGLEQLQPNVDFMDTFEPIHDVISRMQGHTFTLPTVQEESTNYDVNKDQEDLLSLFGPSTDSVSTQIENELPKPILEQSAYSSQNIFPSSNEMLNLNAKLDANVLVEQQQAPSLGDNFTGISKLELSSEFATNYQSQIAVPNAVFGPTSSLHEAPMHNQAHGKSQMSQLNSIYSNRNPVNTMNSSIRSESSHSYVSRFPQHTLTEPQPSTSQVNIFQPDPSMFYSEQQNVPLKPINKNGKYSYSNYYHNSGGNDKQYVHSMNSSEMAGKGSSQNRSRSKSITMPHANKSVTIKSLLNKPSLVSSINASDGAFVSNSTFRVPNASEVSSRSGNMERSLSLPIYSQELQQRKQCFSSQLLQRLQSNEPGQAGHQFEASGKLNEPNYSFDSSVNNFYPNSVSAATSPLSSHSSTYSNQDTQILPQVSNSNPQQPLRKVSHPGLDYSKVAEPQLALPSIGADNIAFQSSQNPNLLSSLLQVGSSGMGQNSVFSPHPSTSSSSSSPIGSLEGSSKINLANSSLNSASFTIGGIQAPFSAMGKSNRLKTDYTTEPVLDLKRNLKKPSNTFEFTLSKEKLVGEPHSSPFSSSDLSLSPVQKSPYKHMSSAALSPTSLASLGLSLKSDDRNMYRERRRVCHINAEQKRRCNIKNGFDTLRNLLPSLSSNTNTKISKAAMLQKAAEYIRILKSEKYDQQKEYEMLKQQVESLNQTISVFQNQLPATGAPIMGQRSSQIKEQYALYVHSSTMRNWKFWLFSIIMESLLDSYCNTVATTNFDEMCKTLFRWLDQSCCLITLRRDVLNSLRFISTSTNILTNPEALPEEALLAVTKSKHPSKDDEALGKFAGL